MTSKRHAKPTALQLVNRLYRQSLAREKDVDNQLAIIRLDLQDSRLRAKTVKTLIDHCARLLREKETLQRRLYAVKELKDEARTDAIAEAVKYKIVDDSEVTIHSHSPGSECAEDCRTFKSGYEIT